MGKFFRKQSTSTFPSTTLSMSLSLCSSEQGRKGRERREEGREEAFLINFVQTAI